MKQKLKARFLTLEGIDGAGKSSHSGAICDYLRAQGETVVLTREPGGSELAEALRGLLLHREMSALTELLLVFAARKDHLDRVIMPALECGAWVISDRFTDATWAYQGGGKGVPAEQIAWLERQVQDGLRPRRTYWFDLDPAVAAQRRDHDRSAGGLKARGGDRFEAEDLEFFERVREAYARRAAANPDTYLRLDASLSKDALAERIREDLDMLNGAAT